ncbi:cytidine deaminase, partial [Streptomyces sp. NPDC054802]
MTQSSDLGPEDRKIITLARSARARNGVPEGAAVRDETGRTYVAGTVALDSLKLSALQTAVAMAVASGATSLEAGGGGARGGPAPPTTTNAPRGTRGGGVGRAGGAGPPGGGW